MKCMARVHEEALEIRSGEDRSLRCQRTGLVWIPGAFGKRLFCYQHAPIQREHNRIVERILSLGG